MLLKTNDLAHPFVWRISPPGNTVGRFLARRGSVGSRVGTLGRRFRTLLPALLDERQLSHA
jgi:hypothetical protein